MIVLIVFILLVLESNLGLLTKWHFSNSLMNEKSICKISHSNTISLIKGRSTAMSKYNLMELSALTLSDDNLYKSPTRGFYVKIKGKTLNLFGLYCAIVTFSIAVLVLPAFSLFTFICNVTGNGKKRRILDWIVHYWAKFSIKLALSNPVLIGEENLPSYSETVIYVPNHTSFLDILFLSGFIPRPFKYLSKAEIARIPVIGQCMTLAKHVFLKRDDIVSTIEATTQTTQRILDGNSMVLFAEGTRSNDGRLKTFKKGAFQIARETGAKIIPISIGNLHRWMPYSALMPLAPMRDTYIKIHPAIEPAGKTVNQMKNLCLQAVNSGLPDHQKMLDFNGLKTNLSESNVDTNKREEPVNIVTQIANVERQTSDLEQSKL